MLKFDPEVVGAPGTLLERFISEPEFIIHLPETVSCQFKLSLLDLCFVLCKQDISDS